MSKHRHEQMHQDESPIHGYGRGQLLEEALQWALYHGAQATVGCREMVVTIATGQGRVMPIPEAYRSVIEPAIERIREEGAQALAAHALDQWWSGLSLAAKQSYYEARGDRNPVLSS